MKGNFKNYGQEFSSDRKGSNSKKRSRSTDRDSQPYSYSYSRESSSGKTPKNALQLAMSECDDLVEESSAVYLLWRQYFDQCIVAAKLVEYFNDQRTIEQVQESNERNKPNYFLICSTVLNKNNQRLKIKNDEILIENLFKSSDFLYYHFTNNANRREYLPGALQGQGPNRIAVRAPSQEEFDEILATLPGYSGNEDKAAAYFDNNFLGICPTNFQNGVDAQIERVTEAQRLIRPENYKKFYYNVTNITAESLETRFNASRGGNIANVTNDDRTQWINSQYPHLESEFKSEVNKFKVIYDKDITDLQNNQVEAGYIFSKIQGPQLAVIKTLVDKKDFPTALRVLHAKNLTNASFITDTYETRCSKVKWRSDETFGEAIAKLIKVLRDLAMIKKFSNLKSLYPNDSSRWIIDKEEIEKNVNLEIDDTTLRDTLHYDILISEEKKKTYFLNLVRTYPTDKYKSLVENIDSDPNPDHQTLQYMISRFTTFTTSRTQQLDMIKNSNENRNKNNNKSYKDKGERANLVELVNNTNSDDNDSQKPIERVNQTYEGKNNKKLRFNDKANTSQSCPVPSCSRPHIPDHTIEECRQLLRNASKSAIEKELLSRKRDRYTDGNNEEQHAHNSSSSKQTQKSYRSNNNDSNKDQSRNNKSNDSKTSSKYLTSKVKDASKSYSTQKANLVEQKTSSSRRKVDEEENSGSDRRRRHRSSSESSESSESENNFSEEDEDN